MPEPENTKKINAFLSPDVHRSFKKLALESDTPMWRRIEAWILFDIKYMAEYKQPFDIEELNKMYFGEDK